MAIDREFRNAKVDKVLHTHAANAAKHRGDRDRVAVFARLFENFFGYKRINLLIKDSSHPRLHYTVNISLCQ